MHDQSFPESAESHDKRSQRAIDALQYEQQAGLGYRRRVGTKSGNPYADPERRLVDVEPTSGELWAGFLSGMAIVLGFGALFFKPLLLGFVALMLATFGSLGNDQSHRLSKIGMTVAGVGFIVGMLMAIFVTQSRPW